MTYAYTDAPHDSPNHTQGIPIDPALLNFDELCGEMEVAARQLEAPSLSWLIDCFARDPGGM